MVIVACVKDGFGLHLAVVLEGNRNHAKEQFYHDQRHKEAEILLEIAFDGLISALHIALEVHNKYTHEYSLSAYRRSDLPFEVKRQTQLSIIVHYIIAHKAAIVKNDTC